MRIAVVGDIMVDRYIMGDSYRISPEAPVPIVRHETTRNVIGGAGNVYHNLLGLGAETALFGMIGDDPEGQWIRKKVMGRKSVLVNVKYPTTLKTRILSNGHQIVRLDREVRYPMERETSIKVADLVKKYQPDAVIFSDYGKGFVTKDLVDEISKGDYLLIADPKDDLQIFGGFDTITPNESEWLGLPMPDVNNILVTLGSKGMKLIRGKEEVQIPSMAREVYDVTGAGDTVVATYTFFRCQGMDPLASARLANFAGGIVVGRIGTSRISIDDLKEYVDPFNNVKVIKKKWGREIVFANSHLYCGKLLCLDKGFRCSRHYHIEKDETFYVLSGNINLELNGNVSRLIKGDSVRIKPGDLHSFSGLDDSIVLEVSTEDHAHDSYRSDKSGPIQ